MHVGVACMAAAWLILDRTIQHRGPAVARSSSAGACARNAPATLAPSRSPQACRGTRGPIPWFAGTASPSKCFNVVRGERHGVLGAQGSQACAVSKLFGVDPVTDEQRRQTCSLGTANVMVK